MNNDFFEIKKMFSEANAIAIYMHVNPDCDCLGSALALYAFLTKMGKKAVVFSPDLTTNQMYPEKIRFLPGFDIVNTNESNITKFDLSVGLDTGDAGRLGEIAFRKFVKARKTLVIDHHEIHEDYAQYTYREWDAVSTTQILYKLFCYINPEFIDKDTATCLYAGMVTDSGGFTFESNSAESYYIASKLIEKGIDFSAICERLLKDITKRVYILKNRVLSRTKFYENDRIAIIVFRLKDFEETNTSDKDTDGIINNAQNVCGVDLAISIAEIAPKKYKLSFRSKNNVNAAACAKCFGGGGHYRAAGCRLFGDFDDVYEKVLTMAKEMIYND